MTHFHLRPPPPYHQHQPKQPGGEEAPPRLGGGGEAREGERAQRGDDFGLPLAPLWGWVKEIPDGDYVNGRRGESDREIAPRGVQLAPSGKRTHGH